MKRNAKTYFGRQLNLLCCYKPLQESNLSRATKIILYKTLIRLVLSYGAEAWKLTKKEEEALLIFERKIIRRIYVSKYENGDWRSRTNRELEEMSKGENEVNG